MNELISMTELEKALQAKGYETKREPEWAISIKLEEGCTLWIGGDHYPDDMANRDNLSWWIDEEVENEDGDIVEETVTCGSPFEDKPFTVEVIADEIDNF